MMMSKRFIVARWLLFAVLIAVLGVAQGKGKDDPVVIELDGTAVTRSEFGARFEANMIMLANLRRVPIKSKDQIDRLRRRYLEQRATELVLLREAQRRGIEPSPDHVKSELGDLLAQFSSMTGGVENVGEIMRRAGFRDKNQLRGIVREQQTIKLLTRQLVQETDVDEADVAAYYRKVRPRLASPAKVCLRQIRTAGRDAARALLGRLKAGADFETLAREESTDVSSADRGGVMGCFDKHYEGPDSALAEAAFEAGKGDIVGPVRSRGEYYLLQVYDRRDARVPELDEVRGRLERELAQEKLVARISALRRESGVKTYPDRLGSQFGDQAALPRPIM